MFSVCLTSQNVICKENNVFLIFYIPQKVKTTIISRCVCNIMTLLWIYDRASWRVPGVYGYGLESFAPFLVFFFFYSTISTANGAYNNNNIELTSTRRSLSVAYWFVLDRACNVFCFFVSFSDTINTKQQRVNRKYDNHKFIILLYV